MQPEWHLLGPLETKCVLERVCLADQMEMETDLI